MDSFFARNRLSAYLDGELPVGEAREVEAAMLRDPALRSEYEQLRAAVELLRTGGPMSAPEGFAGRLHVRLAAEPAPTRWRTALRRVRPEPAAIAAIAAAALIYVGVRHDPPAPVEPPEVAVAQAPGLPRPDAPVASDAAPAAASDAPLAPAGADGVLGNEGAYANHAPSRRGAPAPTRTASSGVEKEAFEASWEREAAASPDAASPEGAAAPAPTLYSPAPWRYRVHATGENPLKELITVAASLGGRIVDARGRPLADYPMDEGDAKSVRVFVPSYNVEALQRKLGEIGSVDTIATDADTLYQNGAEVPVAIEVQR